MIFLVEVSIATLRFVFRELPVAGGKQLSIFLCRNACVELTPGGDVTGKGKHVYPGLHNGIDDAGKLRMIYLGNGGHNDAANAGLVDTAYFLQCAAQ